LQSAGLVKPAPKRFGPTSVGCFANSIPTGAVIITYAKGWRVGLEDGAHASQPRPGPARHPPYRGLFARGARPFGARAFEGLQGRVRKELALAGITIMAAANRWMAECYLPAHNEAFAVMPEQMGTASVRDRTASQVVCLQEEPGSVTKTRQMARAHSAVRRVIGGPSLGMHSVEGCAGWPAQSLMSWGTGRMDDITYAGLDVRTRRPLAWQSPRADAVVRYGSSSFLVGFIWAIARIAQPALD